jgi:endonuclease YncB( thermonuclease family)
MLLLLPLLLSAFSMLSCATELFNARCVAVFDGDSIVVRKGDQEVEVRLEGIDCPEKGSPFSDQARQFTEDLVLGKNVIFTVKELDQYGRTVARVRTRHEIDVSLELLRAGLAWHYKRYVSDPTLALAEKRAREAKKGIWSLPNPVPPWEVKAAQRNRDTGTPAAGNLFYGNVKSHVFHGPWCQNYQCKNCKEIFRSREEAIRAGYRPAGCCRP